MTKRTTLTPQPPGIPLAQQFGKLNTVPLHVAQVWLQLPTTPHSTSDLPLVPYGYRWEVDLDSMPTDTAASLHTWFTTVKTFWRLGGPRSHPHFTTRRLAVTYTECVDKGNKTDLGFLLPDLKATPGVDRIIREVTSADPNWEAISAAVTSTPGGQLHRDGHTATTTIGLPLSTPLPARLGGLPMIGQTSRAVEVSTNYAKWRNRRARRLTKVETVIHDAWPKV